MCIPSVWDDRLLYKFQNVCFFILAQQQVQIPKYLQRLISQGEHQTLDFKYAINDMRKIAITLCAFSNTDGGKLLIGVKDNGAIAGSKLEEDIYMIEMAARTYCRPPVDFKEQGWKAGDRYVLEITVDQCFQRPCMAQDSEGRWAAFIRSEDQNYLAPSALLQYWKLEERTSNEKYFHTETEQKLQAALQNEEGLSVSHLTRMTGIPHRKVNALLAKLMRWELVIMTFEHGIARFKNKNDTSTSSHSSSVNSYLPR